MGSSSSYYPWKWSIYNWLEGETAVCPRKKNLYSCHFVHHLDKFLIVLKFINPESGILLGAHNFHLGGDIKVYDSKTQKALLILNNKYFTKIWEEVLNTAWQNSPNMG